MEDMGGLNRLSFWPKIKVSCANEETPSSAFLAQETAGKQQNLRAGCGNLHFLGRR